jgi:hypothetical protein
MPYGSFHCNAIYSHKNGFWQFRDGFFAHLPPNHFIFNHPITTHGSPPTGERYGTTEMRAVWSGKNRFFLLQNTAIALVKAGSFMIKSFPIESLYTEKSIETFHL